MTAQSKKRTSNIPTEVVVLDAHTRQSLLITRYLGEKKIRIAAFATNEKNNVPTFYSKWCKKSIIVPYPEGSFEYATFLLTYVKDNHVSLIISSSDGTIDLLRKYRSKIEKYAPIAFAKEPGLSIAIDKRRTLRVAKQLGITIPKSVIVQHKKDIKNAIEQIGLPAVVKPNESWVRNEKESKRLTSVLVVTKKEAVHETLSLLKDGGTVLFQQYLNGRREAVSMLYSKGRIYARFAQWAKRVQPPLGGQSVLRQSIQIPKDIGIQAEKLIKKINLEGYSEVEFRRDDTGLAYLMEINPRVSASVEIAIKSGINYPYLIYKWGTGQPINQVKNYITGNWMRYLGGDIITSLESIKHNGRPGIDSPLKVISDFFTSFFYPVASYDYVDWADPKPLYVAVIGFFQALPIIYKNSRVKK